MDRIVYTDDMAEYFHETRPPSEGKMENIIHNNFIIGWKWKIDFHVISILRIWYLFQLMPLPHREWNETKGIEIV